MGLTHELLCKSLSEYSGGELKKFYLAVAFSKQSELLVLDEPTNHIDVAAVDFLIQLIRERSGALLVCSHDDRLEPLHWDRTYAMKDGELYE